MAAGTGQDTKVYVVDASRHLRDHHHNLQPCITLQEIKQAVAVAATIAT